MAIKIESSQTHQAFFAPKRGIKREQPINRDSGYKDRTTDELIVLFKKVKEGRNHTNILIELMNRAKDANTPPKELFALAKNENSWIRAALFDNSKLPKEIYKILYYDHASFNNHSPRIRIMQSMNTPPALLDEISRDPDSLMRGLLYYHPSATAEMKTKAANYKGMPYTGEQYNGMLGINALHKRGFKGKGVKIVVIDYFVDANHENFRGFLWHNRVDYFDKPKDKSSFSNGHGTEVAGVIAGRYTGVAPESELISVNMINNIQEFEDLAKIIIEKNRNGENIRVVSYSSSFPVNSNKIGRLNKIFAELNSNGVTIVTTRLPNRGQFVGDVGENFRFESEATEKYINVGASGTNHTLKTTDDFLSYCTQLGIQYDIMAPGQDVFTSIPDGAAKKFLWSNLADQRLYETIKNPDDLQLPQNQNSGYTYVTGISFAIPFVSGVISLMVQANPKLRTQEIKEILIKTAAAIKPANGKSFGQINPQAAVDEAINRASKR